MSADSDKADGEAPRRPTMDELSAAYCAASAAGDVAEMRRLSAVMYPTIERASRLPLYVTNAGD